MNSPLTSAQDIRIFVRPPQDSQEENSFDTLYEHIVQNLVKKSIPVPCTKQEEAYRVLGFYKGEKPRSLEKPVGIGSASIEEVRDPATIARILGKDSDCKEIHMGRIWKLGVHKHYRNRGIGDTILGALEDYMMGQGVSLFEFNVPASDFLFYQKRGYEMVNEGPNLLDCASQFTLFKYQ